jgi:hypothetical protein
MTQDEIIEMAKQAGWKDMKDYDSEMNESFFIGKFTDLKAFANLIAQHEREACAKIVEESSLPDTYSQECLPEIANDIRARKQA